MQTPCLCTVEFPANTAGVNFKTAAVATALSKGDVILVVVVVVFVVLSQLIPHFSN